MSFSYPRSVACASLASILILSASLSAQSPGDRDHLKAVHPGYTLSSVMPPGLNPGVSGMDFLADGRLVISTWGGDHKILVPPSQKGEVYVLSNVGQDDSTKMTYKKLIGGLQEPLGLKVINDTIYLAERQALSALTDKNGNGVVDTGAAAGEYRKLASYATGGQRHEFFFGLVYKDGFFYGAHSLSLANGGTAALPQPNPNRGTYVKIEKATGKTEFIAGGNREPFGFVMNPAGEIFSTEVQGTWNPACAFTQVRAGRFYGHPQIGQDPPNVWDTKPYNAPAVLLPETEIANAPGEPVYVDKGQFQGQYLYGDVTYGGIQRIYLEKIGQDYQGGVVRFSAGFMGGVSRLKFAPNGDLIVGQIGDADGNWNEPGRKLYGLQKLKANGKTAFEMNTVRSRPQGMEIEFTEPVALDADQIAKYEVKSWTYTRTATYGGPAINKKTLTVTKVQVDASRKKVYLEVNGLTAGYLVYIRLVGLKSATGGAPWSTETWYTLNAFGSGEPFDPSVSVSPVPGRLASNAFAISRVGGRVGFRVETKEAYVLRVTDARGALVTELRGKESGNRLLPLGSLAPGLYVATLVSGGSSLAKSFASF
ncbi:MAG: hypothetical protein JWP91_873 [Fibrobacteres bacterium]|nr:hypothetical protein [Fibrobacterota bacterium]